MPVQSKAGAVDLHAHLFMKEALGVWFRGDWDEPLKARSWKDGVGSKANMESLKNSDLSIVVAALYAHKINGDLRASIRRQILLAKDFVKKNPQWILGLSPDQVEKALSENKHVLILSLEGASGILQTDEDLREFIDEGGIRLVTLMHFTDDDFGGVAFMKGTMALLSPWALMKSLFHPAYEDGVRVNPKGLTVAGQTILEKLSDKHVWIDLAHASDKAQESIISFYAQKNWPLLYTHTALRHYFKAERGISDKQLQSVKDSGGIIGLLPSTTFMEGTPSAEQGLSQFAKQFDEASQVIGLGNVMLGSDFNAPLKHLPPGSDFSREGLDDRGFWNISQENKFWAAVKDRSTYRNQLDLNQSATFLKCWKKLF